MEKVKGYLITVTNLKTKKTLEVDFALTYNEAIELMSEYIYSYGDNYKVNVKTSEAYNEVPLHNYTDK